jgi:acetyl esterase
MTFRAITDKMISSSLLTHLIALAYGNYLAHRLPNLPFKTTLVSFLLDKFQLFPRVPPNSGQNDVDWYRSQWDYLALQFKRLPGFPPILQTQDLVVKSTSGTHEIPVRLYRPHGVNVNEVLPLFVFIHGGGFVFGSIDFYEAVCRQLANCAKVVVCSVGYRLAPEHKFPCAFLDCVDVVVEFAQKTTMFNSSPQTHGLFIGGDSAGGNLSAAVALFLQDKVTFKLQVLIYPTTCAYGMPMWRQQPWLIKPTDSIVINARAALVTSAVLPWVWSLYLANDEQALDERASPMLTKRAENVCPALVITAGGDCLRDEGREFATMLRRRGARDVQLVDFDKAVHAFMSSDMYADFGAAWDVVARAVRGERVSEAARL